MDSAIIPHRTADLEGKKRNQREKKHRRIPCLLPPQHMLSTHERQYPWWTNCPPAQPLHQAQLLQLQSESTSRPSLQRNVILHLRQRGRGQDVEGHALAASYVRTSMYQLRGNLPSLHMQQANLS